MTIDTRTIIWLDRPLHQHGNIARYFQKQHQLLSPSPSSFMTCPVIWGRRYSWCVSSSILPSLLRCPAAVISLLHASFRLRFGRPLLLFPGMSTSSILLSMCSSLILITWPYHFSRFSVISWTLAPLLLSLY